MLLPPKYALIIALLSCSMIGAAALLMIDLFANMSKLDGLSLASWLIADLGLICLLMVALAAIITVITWGYWLGDLGKGDRFRGQRDRSEEERAALELLEQKYARHEITMTEYLALRKGVDRDRPKY